MLHFWIPEHGVAEFLQAKKKKELSMVSSFAVWSRVRDDEFMIF